MPPPSASSRDAAEGQSGPQVGAPPEPSTPALIDTHAHLTARAFARDLNAVLERACRAGVTGVVVVGYNLASSRAAVELAERHPQLYATVGIHPHDARDVDGAALDELRRLARRPRVVAIGETGLDFYRNLSPPDRQRSAFERQLDLAAAVDLPVVVHSRAAMAETLSMLRRALPPRRGVLHCFDGTVEQARPGVGLGLYLSYAGPLTYRKDPTLGATAAAAPPDRIVVETDAPYLTPQPWRGRRNEPAYVREVAQALARIRAVAYADVATLVTRNAIRLFRLDAVPEVVAA